MSEFHVQVVRIGDVEKHPNADSLSITNIHGGYPVIFRTGDFAPGDLAVYIPVDSLVPTTEERFAFLGDGSGKPARIRAKKLRGVFSMGLLSPAAPDMTEGDDVRELLAIGKWVPAIECASTGGDNEPDPGCMPFYTDLDGLRKYRTVIQPDEEVVCTEKIHGANGRFCFVDGRLWCGSRTQIKADTETSVWWQVARGFELAERLAEVPGIAIYGEVYGRVQDLRYGHDRAVSLVLFDAMDLATQRYLDYDAFKALAARLGLPTVPELYRGRFADVPADLAEGVTVLANGAHVREGYVVRPVVERWDQRVGRVVLKMVGEGYHLRKSAA